MEGAPLQSRRTRELEQQLVLPMLRVGAAALSVVLAGYAAVTLAGPATAARPLLPAAAVSALTLALVAVLLPSRPSPRLAHPLLAGYAALVGVNVLAALVVRGTPWATAWLLLVLVALGVTMVSPRWFAGTAGALAAAWAVAWAPVRLGDGASTWSLVTEAATVVGALALATLAFLLRHRLAAQLVQAREALEVAAVEDELTGLANRRGVFLLGSQVLEAARRQGDAVHAAFLDVNGLARVNELAGYEAGDEVLVVVAEALRAVTRATDVVGRWGADEFCIVGPGPGVAPVEIEKRVRGHITREGNLPTMMWTPRVTAGTAMLAPWDDGDLGSLLAAADREMYLRRETHRQVGARRWFSTVEQPESWPGGLPGEPGSLR